MNVLRKAMAREVEELKPLLDRAYASILRFQQSRTPEAEAEMRATLEPVITRLGDYRSLLPAYKQRDFRLLETEWRGLTAHDLIMLFDHCISIMHVRLERKRSANELQQPWSAELLRLLDGFRDGDQVPPAAGEFLCSGIAASGGRARGRARVVVDQKEINTMRAEDILVCRCTTPDLVQSLASTQAVVTDVGGVLSHAAIIAREMNVPAVTGCGNATAVIRTGDEIGVDGDLGLVMAVTARAS